MPIYPQDEIDKITTKLQKDIETDPGPLPYLMASAEFVCLMNIKAHAAYTETHMTHTARHN